MTEAQVVALLKRQVAKSRSIRQWSRDHDIDHVFVWRVMTEARPLSDNVAAAMGFEKVVTYRRIRR